MCLLFGDISIKLPIILKITNRNPNLLLPTQFDIIT